MDIMKFLKFHIVMSIFGLILLALLFISLVTKNFTMSVIVFAILVIIVLILKIVSSLQVIKSSKEQIALLELSEKLKRGEKIE